MGAGERRDISSSRLWYVFCDLSWGESRLWGFPSMEILAGESAAVGCDASASVKVLAIERLCQP